MTRDYTPEELRRGRFLRHFMGLMSDFETDPTIEDEALPLGTEPPKTRESPRPTPEPPRH